ncbi:MAG: cyclic nucleotide-binding domain-containing protein [Deltaproteobacteria bacterium]|nr:MAG: cyclic nucleotide-binding domain-containing protein [Deltaproteobacteria bacterium]
MQRTIQALQGTAAFAGITDDALAFLLERSKTIQVPRGHVFFREHDYGDTLFLLVEGEVEIFKTRDGIRRDVGELGEGECFGEMALLSVTDRSATVMATAPCVCIELSNRALLALYERDVGQFAMIVMNLGREVCRRLRDLNEVLLSQEVARAYASRGEEAPPIPAGPIDAS